jgi:hypothetical protein
VVAGLPLDPRFAEDDGILKDDKIPGSFSFRGEVKPSVPCCRLLHVKVRCNYERDRS